MPQFNTVNAIDYGLIALYFGIVIWVGFYAAKKNKDTDDYFKGGGQVPWFLAGVSNWVSGFSAFMFVAAAGFTYKNGAGAIVVFTTACWAYLVGYFFFAPMWRRARLSSPLQFLTRRYSPSTTYFYSVTAIVPQVIGIGQGLYILCIFVATALGFGGREFELLSFTVSGLQLTMLVVGAVMIIYTVVGGLWAAVLSDAVQGVIIAVMTLIIFPVAFLHLGGGDGIGAGFARLGREAPAGFLALSGPAADPWWMLGYLINVMLGYNVAWWQVQRYQSVPDERGAKKMALLCAGLSVVGPLLWILPVMAARILFPDMGTLWPAFKAPEEASFVSLALLLLPHGMIGFVVAAILSATLGQANDSFNWLAATTTRDVYVPLRRRLGHAVPTERQQMVVAQITMLIVGVLGVAVAFYIPRLGGAFSFALNYYSIVGPGFMMPVALGLIYRKTPWWSGMAACVAAFAAIFTLIALDVWPDNAMPRNVLSAAGASTLVFFLSTRWYRADDPRSAEAQLLDVDLRTPVPVESTVVAAGSLQVYGVIGTICLVLGVVLVGCWVVPGTTVAPAVINVVAGGMLLALGVGLRRFAASGTK
jgi:SSS family solute:Na+ symporter